MKLRTFAIVFFIILTCLAGVNLVLGYFLIDIERKIEQTNSNIKEMTSLSDELVLSSQFQTRFARAYVVNKDPRRFLWYGIINDILDGKITRPENYTFTYWDMVAGLVIPAPDNKKGALSIEERLRRAGASAEEMSKLQEARGLFAKMGAAEIPAMHAMNGEFDDGAGSFTRKGRPDTEMARQLLFSENYNTDNGLLSKVSRELTEMVSARLSKVINQQVILRDQLLSANTYLAVIVFSLIIASILYLNFRFASRAGKLMQSIKRISTGDFDTQEEIFGHDEIGVMAEAINHMRANLASTVLVASRLSDGDLTGNIQILSENDRLGLALRNMTDKLTSIILSLRDITNGVTVGSVQLQSASKQVSDGANEQASSVQETAAAMEQIAASIRQNAEASNRTQKTSIRLSEDARTCAQAMQQTAVAMKNIADKSMAVEEITRKIELLALNASVEAARAGEHGKGFAVVAAEVSKLAELSKEAASAIQQSSVEGKETAENTNRMLTNLLPEIERAKDLVQGISLASDEQATGTQQVNVAVRRLDEVTQSNASAASEMAATANALADHASELQKAISWFKTRVISENPSNFQANVGASNLGQKALNRTMDEKNLGKY